MELGVNGEWAPDYGRVDLRVDRSFSGQDSLVVTTDADGAFAFQNLSAFHCYLSAKAELGYGHAADDVRLGTHNAFPQLTSKGRSS